MSTPAPEPLPPSVTHDGTIYVRDPNGSLLAWYDEDEPVLSQ